MLFSFGICGEKPRFSDKKKMEEYLEMLEKNEIEFKEKYVFEFFSDISE